MAQKESKAKLEGGFVKLRMGTRELVEKDEEQEQEEECYWVPASVSHKTKLDTSGLSTHSFFVYGGVNLQAWINLRQGGNAPLGGNRVSGSQVGGNFNRRAIIKGFQDHHIISNQNNLTKEHKIFTLAGMNINQRANKITYLVTPRYISHVLSTLDVIQKVIVKR